MSNINDLIKSANENDIIEFKQTFNKEMILRSGVELEQQRVEVTQGIFGDDDD